MSSGVRGRAGASFLLALALTAAWSGGARAQPAALEVAAHLEHAAYRTPGAPSVIVHAPPGFDPRAPLTLVVFLHGLSGCVSVLMAEGEARCKPDEPVREGWDLGRFHDAAHTNSLFVVPQLAYMKRDGRPGAFAQPGGFRAFLNELLAGPLAELLGGARSLKDVARIELLAHSAGYQTALAILEHGGLPADLVRSVVLFDALYDRAADFERYILAHAARGLRFVSISLANGTPERESRALAQRLRARLGAAAVVTNDATGIGEAVKQHPIVFARGKPPHRLVPATHMTEVLVALSQAAAQ